MGGTDLAAARRRAVGTDESATFAESLAGRRNSLNFLRLVFATMVIAAHAVSAGGFGTGVIHGRLTLGTVGVFGFFAISGYLVAQSASRNSVGRYLWQRFLRIFPGFWVCLIVTAFLFGAVGWFEVPRHPMGCGLTCFYQNRSIPYVIHNFFLRINDPYLKGTLGHYPLINSPLWTLFYEFLCYLILAALALVGLLRRRAAVLSLTTLLWVAEGYVVIAQHQSGLSFDEQSLLSLAPVFLTGTVVFLYRGFIPDSGWIALSLGLAAFASLYVPLGQTTFGPITNFVVVGSSIDLFAPLVVYPVLWLGTHLPLHKVGAKNDYSYGLYIYAFPVQVFLATWHVPSAGFLPYFVACLAATAPFAVVSWWLVERRALSLKGIKLETADLRPTRSDAVPVAEKAFD